MAMTEVRRSSDERLGRRLIVGVDKSSGEGVRQLLVVDLDGNDEALPLDPRAIGLVSWSPDGQSVVYSSDNQIYTYNVTLGATPRQLTFEGENVRPVFSPDGTRVAFGSTREGTVGRDLFVKNLDDDSPPRSIIGLDEVNPRPTQGRGVPFVEDRPPSHRGLTRRHPRGVHVE